MGAAEYGARRLWWVARSSSTSSCEQCTARATDKRLYLSVRTVETHVSSLLAKLQLESRGQLTALSATVDYGD